MAAEAVAQSQLGGAAALVVMGVIADGKVRKKILVNKKISKAQRESMFASGIRKKALLYGTWCKERYAEILEDEIKPVIDEARRQREGAGERRGERDII